MWLRTIGMLMMTLGLAGWAMADQAVVRFSAGAGGYPLGVAEFKSSKGAVVPVDGQPALQVKMTMDYGWPGVQLPAPGGKWDLSQYAALEVDLRNSGSELVRVRVRVDNPDADGSKGCLYGEALLEAGQTRTARVELVRRDGLPGCEQLKGMRGGPPGVGGPLGIDAASVSRIHVFVDKQEHPAEFCLLGVRAVGQYQPLVLSEGTKLFPIIDQFGQYKHADWPGKVKSVADLQAAKDAEAAELQAKPGPESWDQFGGWKSGPELRATGFFRVEKYEGKWWLVDPDGRLFFSNGIDSVGIWRYGTPITLRDGWYEGLPDRDDPRFAGMYDTWKVLIGDYAGKQVASFAHMGMNLYRKYGEGWEKRWAEVTHQRLRSWGMNTLGNWSRDVVTKMRRTPYVVAVWTGTVHPRTLAGGTGYWGKFYDVFDQEFAGKMERAVAEGAGSMQSVGDPWCLGYFVDNELSWGDELSFGQATLRSPADQPAKGALLGDLQAKYTTIERLNSAWGTQYASWEAMKASTQGVQDTAGAGDDLRAFCSRTAETYFRTVAEAVRKADPNHLYLGCRFAWVNRLAYEAAAKYCDVVSFNLYRASVAEFKAPPPEVDKPLMIGEFQFGALDRGMWHVGQIGVPTQKDRAEAYVRYMQGALKHPQFVGAHWFEYQDESTTGRPLDGENYNVGFVSITDTPYPEMVAAAREVGWKMYETRAAGR